ncbi:MAG: hypothetical protein OEY07_15470 [Gammaproteobacteria bacterium]|nr:hypothetical protein [Gammaproteobacteria bacterium]
MSGDNVSGIEVHRSVCLMEGKEVLPEHIPQFARYEIHKLNEAGELVYIEICDEGATRSLVALAADGDYQARAEAVLEHAMQNGARVSDYHGNIELKIAVPADGFPIGVELEEDELFEINAILHTNPDEFDVEPASSGVNGAGKPVLMGFIMDVFIAEPLVMRTRKIQYTKDKQLYSIDYILLAINDDNEIVENFNFTEYSSVALAEVADMDFEEEQRYPFPICDLQQFDEAAPYLGMEFVAHVDFTNNPIPDEELLNHENFRRQWFDNEQKPTISQTFFKFGIGHTEILDVPQHLHTKTLHAYLRLIHKQRQRMSTDYVNATPYVVMLEPLSTESTEAVPLEEGWCKRHQSYYTREGVLVVCECFVFSEEGVPLKKYSFGSPNEADLMYAADFEFDENGQLLEPEIGYSVK